ncbi:sensor histidine kinase [Amycolatopsis viridis]|uniref:Anti-sigma regulatory factor (Ser/Thr protein kinase) n=1 Tax=Amycolatopsis viridis TaxID=185678 RepID=A0ABX0SS99_9PSEU|nr:sensor histidine kinase [Amycolatopsis viridis]NIH79849.1 anti-sigma regulatory factor (Ser/Thr protein kinase) [Amycolatopsis viridis]
MTRQQGFVHEALFYSSPHEYLSGLVPFLTEGLAAGDPVAAAVPGPNLALLREALGDDADRVHLLDMSEEGRNPGRIIPQVLRGFADRHPDAARVRIVGEPIWAGRSAAEYPACAQHEALINPAFDGRDVTIVCPYDTSALDPVAIADAYVTHPLIRQSGLLRDSETYAWDELVTRYNDKLEPAVGAVRYLVREPGQLSGARHTLAASAREYGLSETRADDLKLIVTELASNSLMHAGTPCELNLWREGDELVCSAADGGHLGDPLAGRRPPQDGQLSGRGLLLVNDMADLVRMYRGPDGTTIQVRLRLHEDPV